MCVFSRTLPWSCVLRVWDMFFCEGNYIMVTRKFKNNIPDYSFSGLENRLENVLKMNISYKTCLCELPNASF